MSIETSEIFWRKSAIMETANPNNGGRMTAVEAADGVKNAIFPDITQGERIAGSDVYRKVFVHIADSEDLTMVQPYIFVETPTPGEDCVCIFTGTQTDDATTITGTEDLYGSAPLNADIASGNDTITVLLENDDAGSPVTIFRNGDLVRISDMTAVDDANPAHHQEFMTILVASAPVGNVQTIQFTTNLQNSYATADSTRVASVIEAADIEASISGYSEVGGTYTGTIVAHNIGAVQDVWTVTFSDASNFDVVGAVTGSVGAGNTGSDFTPTNSDYGTPYFTMPAGGYSGFGNGDTIQFTTNPAALPLWYRRFVPAGAASLSNDNVIVGIIGQSA